MKQRVRMVTAFQNLKSVMETTIVQTDLMKHDVANMVANQMNLDVTTNGAF